MSLFSKDRPILEQNISQGMYLYKDEKNNNPIIERLLLDLLYIQPVRNMHKKIDSFYTNAGRETLLKQYSETIEGKKYNIIRRATHCLQSERKCYRCGVNYTYGSSIGVYECPIVIRNTFLTHTTTKNRIKGPSHRLAMHSENVTDVPPIGVINLPILFFMLNDLVKVPKSKYCRDLTLHKTERGTIDFGNSVLGIVTSIPKSTLYK
jgi:hypothetical protein